MNTNEAILNSGSKIQIKFKSIKKALQKSIIITIKSDKISGCTKLKMRTRKSGDD